MRAPAGHLGRRLLRVVVVSGAVLAAACGSDGDSSGSARVGDPAPEYRVSTLDGDSVRLSEFRGDPVLLNFWATWCAPCRHETPFLQSIHERFRDRGLQVVGVSMDSPGSMEDIRDFLDEMGVTYEILHDARQRGMDRCSLMGLPATFVLDEEGRIRFARIGPVSEEDREFLDALRQVSS